MNAQSIEKNWTELKGKIKSKWSKISDDEIESAKSDLSQLGGMIQKAYGLAKDQADRQFDEFKKSILSLIGHEGPSAEPATASPKPGPVITPVALRAVEPAANKSSQAV